MNTEKVDIRYLAGLFEGEGSASISKSNDGIYSSMMAVEMCDIEPVKAFRDYFNVGGEIYIRKRKSGWCNTYCWHASGKAAGYVAEQLLPFILSPRKRKSLECVVKFANTVNLYWKLPPQILFRREKLYNTVKRHNARGKDRENLSEAEDFQLTQSADKQLVINFL